MKKSAKALLAGLALRVLSLALAGKLICLFLLGAGIQRGNAMYPGMKDGELGFIWKRASCYAGDVVLYHPEGGPAAFYRVAAVGGDEVMISEEGFTRNGSVPAEPVVYPTTVPGDGIDYPCRIPEGEVFLLNDYRSDPSDSRSFGLVPEAKLEGVLVFSVKRRSF